MAISSGSVRLSRGQIEQAAGSEWELDRIGLYVFEEYSAHTDHGARCLHLEHEFERVRLDPAPRSLLPLHYAIRSLLVLARQQASIPVCLQDRSDLIHTIATFLAQRPQLDPYGETARSAQRLALLIDGDAAQAA